MNCKCKAIPSGHFLVSVVQSLPSQYCLNVLAGCLTDSGERYHQPNISALCTLWAWGNRQRELQERKSKRVLTWDIPSQNTFFPSSPRSFCCLLPLISHLFPNKPAGMSSFSGLSDSSGYAPSEIHTSTVHCPTSQINTPLSKSYTLLSC